MFGSWNRHWPMKKVRADRRAAGGVPPVLHQGVPTEVIVCAGDMAGCALTPTAAPLSATDASCRPSLRTGSHTTRQMADEFAPASPSCPARQRRGGPRLRLRGPPRMSACPSLPWREQPTCGVRTSTKLE